MLNSVVTQAMHELALALKSPDREICGSMRSRIESIQMRHSIQTRIPEPAHSAKIIPGINCVRKSRQMSDQRRGGGSQER
ncbi:hypothetical protein BDZ89DRAFT_1081532 [Hymenopellis radicata]|nr:hypothetical protein BDZ89DRAFT_1081532 [Hymenopellis radicata]